MTDLVTMMRQYALEHYYRYSWDIVATRWSNAEIADAIKGAKTRRGAIAKTWGKLQTIDAQRPKSRRPARSMSLFEFLAYRGGLRHCPDLAYILDGNPMVPRLGPLLRASGMNLDHAREACVEAGYLQDESGRAGAETTSTINELLDAVADEARGAKRYPMGQEPVTAPDYEDETEETDVFPF